MATPPINGMETVWFWSGFETRSRPQLQCGKAVSTTGGTDKEEGAVGKELRVESFWHDQDLVEQELLKKFTKTLPFLYRKTNFSGCTSGVEITFDYF